MINNIRLPIRSYSMLNHIDTIAKYLKTLIYNGKKISTRRSIPTDSSYCWIRFHYKKIFYYEEKSAGYVKGICIAFYTRLSWNSLQGGISCSGALSKPFPTGTQAEELNNKRSKQSGECVVTPVLCIVSNTLAYVPRIWTRENTWKHQQEYTPFLNASISWNVYNHLITNNSLYIYIYNYIFIYLFT